MTNTYRTLLQRWGDVIDAPTRDALTALAERFDAKQAYAHVGEQDDNTAGFLQFGRVFGNTPVALFGQDTPALAYTRLTITRAERQEDGTYVPGAVVLEGRLSDRALTTLVMNSNQGGVSTPITGERMNDTILPPYIPPAEKPSDTAFQEGQYEEQERLKAAHAALRESLEQGGSAKARAAAVRSLQQLQNRINQFGDVRFLVDRRLETMGKRRVELVSEAAHAALHTHHLAEAFTQPRLAPPTPPAFNPLEARVDSPVYNAALNPMEPNERAAMRQILDLEIAAIVEAGGPSAPFFVEKPTWPSGQILGKFSAEARDRIESLNSVARATIYDDHGLDARCLAAGLIWSQGYTGFMHTSLPPTDERYCTLRLESAWMESSYGESRLRSTLTPFLEVELSPDDLMMALRGHPTGAMTPCTFRRLAGAHMPKSTRARATPAERLSRAAKQRVLDAPQTAALHAAIEALHQHLDSPGTSKSWKETAATLAGALDAALQAYQAMVQTSGYDQAEGDIAAVMRTMVRQDLDEIHAFLPEGALPLLLGRN